MKKLATWISLIALSLLWAAPIPAAVLAWRDVVSWWWCLASVYVIEWFVYAIGLFVVAALAARHDFEMVNSLADGMPIITWRPRWAYVWGNLDEGINPLDPPTNASGRRWWDRSRGWSWWRQCFSWSALRNAASNLRFTRFGVRLDPERVEWIGNSTNPGRDWRTVGAGAAVEERCGSLSVKREYDLVNHRVLVTETCGSLTVTHAHDLRRYAFWIFARQGWKVGLWIVAAESGRTTQLGWRIFVFDPEHDREIERYHAMKVQVWRRP